MTHDVFISYPSKDKIVADAVCAKLEEKKIRCWIAPRDIAAGQNFARAIINAIDSCKIFVLIWSVNTNASEHILNEINRAFDQGKPIIPFRIQNVQPTPEMLYYFGRTHWLDALTPPLESHIHTLYENICANLGIEPEPVKVDLPENPVEIKEDAVGISQDSASKQSAVKKAGGKPSAVKKRGNKIWFITIATVLIVALVLLLLRLTGALSGFLPSAQNEPTNLATETPTAMTKTPTPPSKATITPTITVTPLPDWANEFSEPILSILEDREPDFQDDFTIKQSIWQLTSGTNCEFPKVTDGRLLMHTSSDCFSIAYLTTPSLYNFVFSGDIWLKNEITFNIGYNHKLLLRANGTWSVNNCKKECYAIKEGIFTLPASGQPVNLTFISLGERNAVYFDDNPTIYYYDIQSPSTEMLFMMTNGQDLESMVHAEVDNFKVWDLDMIENLSDLLVSP